MNKILISGGNGMFARAFQEINVDYDIIAPTKNEMDIRNREDIEKYIILHEPDIFLHAAAFTRPLAKHENDPITSIETNIIGTSNVVVSCIKHNIKLVYISTDNVYPGIDGDYKEDGCLLPYTNYGWSKLGGESAVKMYKNTLIFRVCMNEKPFSHPKAIADSIKSLIYIDEAAEITYKLLDEFGTINIGGKSQSIYDFAREGNPNIGKLHLKDIKDVNMAKNATMNLTKMDQLLKEKNK